MNHISKKNAVTGKNSEIGPKLAGTFFINSYEKCQKLGHSSKMQGQKNCPSFLRLCIPYSQVTLLASLENWQILECFFTFHCYKLLGNGGF